MSWELVLKHCASVRATLDTTRVSCELVSAQLAGLEAFAKAGYQQEQASKTRIEVPATCDGTKPEDCARLSEDAVLTFGGMAGRGRGCRGCGLELTTT